jgi:hypothetical protein
LLDTATGHCGASSSKVATQQSRLVDQSQQTCKPDWTARSCSSL